MKYLEKLDYLRINHAKTWNEERQKIENEITNASSMFCFCGRLATGLHEMNCSKFQTKVNRATVSKLKHLIKYPQKKDGQNEKTHAFATKKYAS